MNGLIGLHNMIKQESVQDDMSVIQLEALENMDIRDNFITTFGIMDDAYEAANTRPDASKSHNNPSMNSADLRKPDNQNPNNKNGGKIGGSGVDGEDDDLYSKDSSTSESFMDFEDLMEAATSDADDAELADDATEADDADDEDVPDIDAETKEALEMIPESSDEEVAEFWRATEDPDSFEARTVIEAELASIDMIND